MLFTPLLFVTTLPVCYFQLDAKCAYVIAASGSSCKIIKEQNFPSMQVGERPRLTEELELLAQSDRELETDSETLQFLVKLYHQCTEKNPSDRPTAENLYNTLLSRASTISVSRSSKQD